MSGFRLRTAVLLVATATVLAACAAGPNDLVQSSDAGFWLGLWHGIISPITFVISLFTDGVNVYEVHNDGNWYDFGFVRPGRAGTADPAPTDFSPGAYPCGDSVR